MRALALAMLVSCVEVRVEPQHVAACAALVDAGIDAPQAQPLDPCTTVTISPTGSVAYGWQCQALTQASPLAPTEAP